MASALPEQGSATALSWRAWSAMAAETAAPAAATGKAAACNPANLTQGCPRAGLSRTKVKAATPRPAAPHRAARR